MIINKIKNLFINNDIPKVYKNISKPVYSDGKKKSVNIYYQNYNLFINGAWFFLVIFDIYADDTFLIEEIGQYQAFVKKQY